MYSARLPQEVKGLPLAFSYFYVSNFTRGVLVILVYGVRAQNRPLNVNRICRPNVLFHHGPPSRQALITAAQRDTYVKKTKLKKKFVVSLLSSWCQLFFMWRRCRATTALFRRDDRFNRADPSSANSVFRMTDVISCAVLVVEG